MDEHMQKIEGVIFDMDGTLLDTERVLFDIWKKVFRNYRYIMEKELYISIMFRRRADVNSMFLEMYGEDFPINKIREEVGISQFGYMKKNGVPLKQGALEILNFLIDRGYKTALATSSSRERASYLLSEAGIMDKFDVIICGEDVVNSKPDPEIFLKAAEKIGIEPDRCVVLEDSPARIKAARNSGMTSIFVTDMIEPAGEIIRLSHRTFRNLHDVRVFLSELA